MNRKQVNIDMSDDAALFDALNKFRISMGWTWKRFMLVGIAETAAKQGTNPEIVLELVEYLGKKR